MVEKEQGQDDYFRVDATKHDFSHIPAYISATDYQRTCVG